MGPDHYAILGIGPEADAAQITRAFRHLLRTLHPDAAGQDPDSGERLGLVLEAWRVLHDPQTRAAYDRTRAVPAPAARAGARPGPDSAPDSGTNTGTGTDSGTNTGTNPDLLIGPTVVHSRSPRPTGPHIRIGPTVRLDE